ncbi:MAG: DUF4115 domain-containing protein [Fretibacterium sp.]|nr:DUF4115 domain-containing protein [Fretibacterium sp.]
MPVSDREELLRELGRELAARREAAHLSIEDIYDRTRIRLDFLKGIEAGDYKGFPDIVYTKGFVRTYLRLLKAEDLQENFLSCLEATNSAPVPEEPTNLLGNGTSPTKGFKPVSHFWLFLVLFVALVGTGAYVWHVWSTNGFSFAFSRPQPPTLGGEPAGAELSKDESASEDVSLASLLPGSLDVEPDSEPEPDPLPPYLAIRAQDDVWMKVTIGDKVVFSKTLKAGGNVSWDLPAQARITYGRPRAALVTLNGKELGAPNPQAKKTETYLYFPDGTYKKAN